jgi:hypothetical protein
MKLFPQVGLRGAGLLRAAGATSLTAGKGLVAAQGGTKLPIEASSQQKSTDTDQTPGKNMF